MNTPSGSDFLLGNGGEIHLKTLINRSHNQISLENKRLIQLVTLMAQRAAQSDFDACASAPHHHSQGDNTHGTTH